MQFLLKPGFYCHGVLLYRVSYNIDNNSLIPYSRQSKWGRGISDVGMPFPLLPTPKAETSKPSPSMPTKTLRNQRNSGEDMWGLAQTEPFASVPFPTLPRALPNTSAWACLLQSTCSILQARVPRGTDRCPINSLINPLPLRHLPVGPAPKSRNVAAPL